MEILTKMYNYDQMSNYKDRDINLFNTYKDDKQKEMAVYKINDVLTDQISTNNPSGVAEGVDASKCQPLSILTHLIAIPIIIMLFCVLVQGIFLYKCVVIILTIIHIILVTCHVNYLTRPTVNKY
ncbi:envelope protein [Glossina pallidipes salivary gland hypertrophy virus]|uniref:Uncharacterized protein n=2 Tax=Glossina hytrovirus (isolate Glossina pallidipes/Ethiopia/Seibersdorf/-) TaxID=379529 RepID=B0YLJ6_GHVS|nr:hypothetical protein SGHV042 [Glossina pallidipes salivary gland hypertrophy virus]ABQ08815.1 hypothetical protein SGHV042 [Glossina pallidipes salivary gland hypertrophy virus]AMB48647.1 envelope protein [Glossina pallidipes salivary gland hypertrophy virus]